MPFSAAAIGLWSTPEELVTGLVAIARGLQCGSGGIKSSATNDAPFISTDTLSRILSLDAIPEGSESWSRGFRIHSFGSEARERDRNKIMLSHRGRSLGYRCWAGVVVDLEDVDASPTALAIMTNSEEGDSVRDPLIIAFADWFDVPFDAACQLKPIVPLPQIERFIDVNKTEKICNDVCGRYLVEETPSRMSEAHFSISSKQSQTGTQLAIVFPEKLANLSFDLLPAAWRGAQDCAFVYRVEGFKTAVMFCVKHGQISIDTYLIQEDKQLLCRKLSDHLE